MIDPRDERGLKTIKMESYDNAQFEKALKEASIRSKEQYKKEISRYAILKDEHCCFGYFKEFDGDCEMCEASLCCEENTDDDIS
jgi:hypothetical protein